MKQYLSASRSSTVRWVDMPLSQMTAALTAGRIDASETAYPAMAETLEAGNRFLDPGYEATAREFVVGGWFCKSDFVRDHTDTIRRFADVMAKAARWANTHQKESALILQKWTGQVVSPTMPRVHYGEKLILSQVQPIIDVSVKYHALKTPLLASDLIAPQMLNAVRR